MNLNITRRNLVRLITFAIAIIASIVALSIIYYNKAELAKRQLNNVYLRSVEELSASTDQIKNSLSKGIYCGTTDQMANIASKLWRDSSTAKIALSSLPLSGSEIDSINRFLSQVGNYAIAVTEKAKEGEGLTLEDYNNLAALYDYSEALSSQLWGMEKKIQGGLISMSYTVNTLGNTKTSDTPSITEGFTEMAEGIENYPTLIYDGPFSDHILEKEPQMLKGLKEVDVNTALNTAAQVSEITADKLVNKDDEAGKMPSYSFYGEDTNISVTKAGGYVSYMLKHRQVSEMKISVNDAIAKANAFLIKNGYENIVTTYYQTLDNICTINFAVQQNDVTIYTDLIKVSIAMDNGEILSLDARGYLINNHSRSMPEKIISAKEAQDVLSPLLTVEKVKLAIIPTGGLNEVLTYEFLCSSRNEQKVLVYVNATTAAEEEILIMYEQANSVLTT